MKEEQPNYDVFTDPAHRSLEEMKDVSRAWDELGEAKQRIFWAEQAIKDPETTLASLRQEQKRCEHRLVAAMRGGLATEMEKPLRGPASA